MKKTLTDFAFTVVGSALVGMALSMFTIPNDIAPGGVSGLATALAHITPIHVSAWTVALNIPLLLGAWKQLGGRSMAFTLLSVGMLSVFIELSSSFLPKYTNNVLMAAFFGGVISGLGIGILFVRGISTGGTDLLALMLKKTLPNVPTGTLLLLVDTAVVVIAVLIFRDIEVALYSTVTIFVTSKVIDALAQGVDYAKVIYTVTAQGDAVAKAIMEHTDRGTTVIPAAGGFTGEEKQLVVTVTRRNVLAQTLKIIKTADPSAFTFVMDSTEVHGEGFKLDLTE